MSLQLSRILYPLTQRPAATRVIVTNVRTRFKRPDTKSPDLTLLKKELPPRSQTVAAQEAIKPLSQDTNVTHPEKEKFPKQHTNPFPKGKVFEKRPMKVPLEAGKTYAWCTCGYGHNQPFCDGAHKRLEGTSFKKTSPVFRPHRFTVEESKFYYLCNCKQTDNRPFCDGQHKKLLEEDSPTTPTTPTTPKT